MGAFKDGGPAFPVEIYDNGLGVQTGTHSGWHTGISVRDYFAAKAMQADLSNWPIDAGDWLKHRADLVHRYYQMADAMLAERAKEQA